MIHISIIPQQLIYIYNIKDKVHNGYIFARVSYGIYGPPQEGRITHDSLVQQLAPYVYRPSNNTLGLWKYGSLPINLTLVVNGFGVTHLGEEYYLHLKASLENKYKVTTDWKGKLYIGISLQ